MADDENHSDDRAKIFKENLKYLMESKGLVQWDIQRTYDREGRKWFGRIYEAGLQRPNVKAVPKLRQLASLLSLPDDYNFWIPITSKHEFPKFSAYFESILVAVFNSHMSEEMKNSFMSEMAETLKDWKKKIDNWQ